MKSLTNLKESIFLLLDAINLLHREAKIVEDNSDISKELIDNLLAILNKSKNTNTLGSNIAIKMDLIDYLVVLKENPFDLSLEKGLLTILDILDDGYDKETIRAMFLSGDDKKKTLELYKSISNYISKTTLSSKLKQVMFNLNSGGFVDINKIIDELQPELDSNYIKSSSSEYVSSEISSSDLADDKIDKLAKIAEKLMNRKVFKTGFQGLNKMLGGGLRAGHLSTTAGLPSNFKTGLAIRLYQDGCTLNTPTKWEDGKESVMVWLSCEDDIGMTIKKMYKSLYVDEHGEEPDLRDMSVKEILKITLEKLSKTGYRVIFKKLDVSNFSYRMLVQELENIESDIINGVGGRIEMLVIDYLAHIPTTGCPGTGGAGTDLREMFRKVSHYCERKAIAFLSPIQINTTYKKTLYMIEPLDFVKTLPNKGPYADSGQLDQEIFCELFTHIATVDGKAYLTIQLGKHKVNDLTPEKDRYMILPMPMDSEGRGTSIRSDIGRKRIDIKSIEELTGGTTGSALSF